MTMLDPVELAEKIQTRFGLGVSGGSEEIDGGKFVVLRPIDLEYPNGFGIVLARTPRLIEAIFKAFAKSIKMAVKRNPESDALPSTKGVL